MYAMVLLVEKYLTQLPFHFNQLLPSLHPTDHKVGIMELLSSTLVNLQAYTL